MSKVYVEDLLGKNGKVVYDFVKEVLGGEVVFEVMSKYGEVNKVKCYEVIRYEVIRVKVICGKEMYDLVNIEDGEIVDIDVVMGDFICEEIEKEYGYVKFLRRFDNYLGENGRKIFWKYVERFFSVRRVGICEIGMWEYYNRCMGSIFEREDGIYLVYGNGYIKVSGDVSDDYVDKWINMD